MYLLDANVFIQAKRFHYGLDICPAFWDWIDDAHARGRVFSIDKVGQELIDGGDELEPWTRARPSLFLSPDTAAVASMQRTSLWATAHPTYLPVAQATFLQDPDSYLVAQALSSGYTVVTHEVTSNSVNRIKVPDACDGLGVSWTTTWQMLRSEGARFELRR